ncbi:restriction endonuclease subunit S [Capnocytophaga sputigena]|uniref:restriction endonuclease subunit S n=1 Tax=Capnocytophaga sputigena TaxID=1019 RepID=UPI0028EB6315|nr:restriction endonuclease subunit S [Capnocytophaga sputigena]
MITNIPKHWKIKKLGDVCKVNQGLQIAIEERFTEPIENGYFYITNEFLKATSKTKYYIKNPSKSVLCSKEDILMTRTGNTGIVVSDVEGVFHNNFFKIDYDKKLLHKDYLVYYLKNDRMQYDILVKAGNSTIPDLNHSDFYTLQIVIPPLEEQEKIAEILLSCDKAIRLTTQIITQLKQRNQGLAQQLLTGEKRVKGFEKSVWKEVKLGELLDYGQPTNYLVKNTDYSNEYKIPVLTAGKTFILGYTNEKEGICTNIPLILFDDFTTDSRYIDFPFKVKSSAVKLLKAKKNVNLRFIFEAMKLIKYAIGGHERHWISKYAFLTIFVPSFKEQNAIAQILDTTHQELKLYEQKLQLLQAQKKTLMQKLLTGEVLTLA